MNMLKEIESCAKELGLDSRYISENAISVFTSPFIALSLRIELVDDHILYYFYHRTSSWTYNGERSDLHDSITSIYSFFLRVNNRLSVHIIDIINPITFETSEIYGRYLIPTQFSKENTISNTSIEFIKTLLADLYFFEQFIWVTFEGCPCENCRKRLGFDYDFRFDNISQAKLQFIRKALNGSDLVNYCERTLPTYFYYRDINRKITIIESSALAKLFNTWYLSRKNNHDSIESISGKLIIDSGFHHYESSFEASQLKKIFKSLGEHDEVKKVYLENKTISFSKSYIIIRDYNCGINAYNKEKDRLKIRHEREFQLLFKPINITWVDKIDDKTFENLIKDILQREKHVTWIRKAAHTNERDDGVDLIAEMVIQKPFITSENESPFTKIKVIIQCKAYKNGVSKSDVTDIRDTVEYRDYDGYFLAVSSYTKKSLSDHLDKIKRDNKIWIDWWSRDEIEERIKNNEDLLYKYSDLFSH